MGQRGIQSATSAHAAALRRNGGRKDRESNGISLPMFEPLGDLQLEHNAPVRARVVSAARYEVPGAGMVGGGEGGGVNESITQIVSGPGGVLYGVPEASAAAAVAGQAAAEERAVKEARLVAFRAKVAARVAALEDAARAEAERAAEEDAEATLEMLSKAALSVYRNVPEMAPLFTRTPGFPARHSLSLPTLNREPRDHVAGIMASAVESALEEEVEKMNFAASRARIAMAALAQGGGGGGGGGAFGGAFGGVEDLRGEGSAEVAPSFYRLPPTGSRGGVEGGARVGVDSPREIDARPPTRRTGVRKVVSRSAVEGVEMGGGGRGAVGRRRRGEGGGGLKSESYRMMKTREAEAEAFGQRRKFMMDLEREKVRRINHSKREAKRIASIVGQKERIRAAQEKQLVSEAEQAEREAAVNRARAAKAERDARARNEHLGRMAERKRTEMARFVEALRAKVVEKVERGGVDIPRLCGCGVGVGLWDAHPDVCAYNCVFFRDWEGYWTAMADLVCSLGID